MDIEFLKDLLGKIKVKNNQAVKIIEGEKQMYVSVRGDVMKSDVEWVLSFMSLEWACKSYNSGLNMFLIYK